MNKKMKIALGVVFVATLSLAGFIYHARTEKKEYDYSPFYEPVIKENNQNEEIEETPEMVLSLSLLKERNPDVVGIIEFKDRLIYEPVVQAPDNEYYERKNLDQKYAAAGISFVTGEGTIYSKNVVVYGHSSTKRDIIFTPLMNYLDYDFYKEHSTFIFETEDEIRTYQIFAVLNFDTKDLNDSQEFMQVEWRKMSDFVEFIEDAKNRSLYQTGVSVSEEDKIMTLVTCDTRDNSKRIVVLAKELNHDQ